MIKDSIRIFMSLLFVLTTNTVVYAQGDISVLVNKHPVRPIDGVYEVSIGAHIVIRITETGPNKFPVVQSALVKLAKIPDGQQQQQQQQQQQLETADDADPDTLHVKYLSGNTDILMDIPRDSSHQIDFDIVLNYIPQRLQAIKRFRGYSKVFKFFLK